MLTVDFGFVTNAGWTKKWGDHKETDDRFGIQLEIQAADHVLNTNDKEHKVHVAFSFGDTVAVASQTIQIKRWSSSTDERKTLERAKIVAVQEDPQFQTSPYGST